MAKRKILVLDIESVKKIETQIREEKIPYDYDTKEYPIEVINMKMEKNNCLSLNTKEIMFGMISKLLVLLNLYY